MLKRTNILALVGGGNIPIFSKNKIIIYDDHQGLIIRQIRFNSDVIEVKLREDCIIGLIEDKIYLLNINSLEIIDIIEIDKLYKYIYGISNTNNLILAFPKYQNKGKVQIIKYFISKKIYQKNDTKIINAHESNITNISINNNGTLLATVSEKGPYIRLFDISNGELVAELKRGKKGKIFNLKFDLESEIFGYINDLGKIYIYEINQLKKIVENNEKEKSDKKDNKEASNKPIEIHKIKEKPIAKYKISENRNILGFSPNKLAIILTSKGKLYKISYNVKSGSKCLKIDEAEINIVN